MFTCYPIQERFELGQLKKTEYMCRCIRAYVKCAFKKTPKRINERLSNYGYPHFVKSELHITQSALDLVQSEGKQD